MDQSKTLPSLSHDDTHHPHDGDGIGCQYSRDVPTSLGRWDVLDRGLATFLGDGIADLLPAKRDES